MMLRTLLPRIEQRYALVGSVFGAFLPTLCFAADQLLRDETQASLFGFSAPTATALLDRLVDERLKAEGTRILAEGWKWVTTSIDLPWDATRDLRAIDRTEVPMTDDEQARVAALEAESEALCEEWSEVPDVPAEVHARIDAIDAELGALVDRPLVFEPAEMGLAGAFVSIDRDGVGELVRIGCTRGRNARPRLKLGVCGEHGGDPASIFFFEECGLDYVSASPFRVPVARLAAAHAVLKKAR